jgi:hypothetical protein
VACFYLGTNGSIVTLVSLASVALPGRLPAGGQNPLDHLLGGRSGLAGASVSPCRPPGTTLCLSRPPRARFWLAIPEDREGGRFGSRRHARQRRTGHNHAGAPCATVVDARRRGTRGHQGHQPVRHSHWRLSCRPGNVEASGPPIVPAQKTPFASACRQGPACGRWIGARGSATYPAGRMVIWLRGLTCRVPGNGVPGLHFA